MAGPHARPCSMDSAGTCCALIPRPRLAGPWLGAPPPQRQNWTLAKGSNGLTRLMPMMEPNALIGIRMRG
eukprot:682495-Alexandrium_andersonii.AAC.1